LRPSAIDVHIALRNVVENARAAGAVAERRVARRVTRAVFGRGEAIERRIKMCIRDRDVPSAYVATMTKAKRKGKIFVDFFRNDYTATAIADYGVRARPSGPVALPIEWSELGRLKAANQFTISDVLERLKKKRPNTDRYTKRQKLPKSFGRK